MACMKRKLHKSIISGSTIYMLQARKIILKQKWVQKEGHYTWIRAKKKEEIICFLLFTTKTAMVIFYIIYALMFSGYKYALMFSGYKKPVTTSYNVSTWRTRNQSHSNWCILQWTRAADSQKIKTCRTSAWMRS